MFGRRLFFNKLQEIKPVEVDKTFSKPGFKSKADHSAPYSNSAGLDFDNMSEERRRALGLDKLPVLQPTDDATLAQQQMVNTIKALRSSSTLAKNLKDQEASADIDAQLGQWMTLLQGLIQLQQKVFFMFAKMGKGWLDMAERLA